MKLSIVIVSWCVQDKLKNNLQAILASTGLRTLSNPAGFSCEIFVVDNNSDDDTVAMVHDLFPQVKIVANKANQGFAYAVNQVLPEAQGEYILLLNPDMLVQPDTLAKLLIWADSHPQATAMSCKLIDQTGAVIKHVRSFPNWLNQLAVIFKLPHLWLGILNNYLLKDFDYNQETKVDSVRGSFLLLRESTIEQVGLLDERYFIWFEDVDYCHSLKNMGLELWYTPSATCVDYVGQSFKQVRTLTTQKYFKDSMLKYFAKWHSRWQVAVLATAWAIAWPVIYLINFLQLKGKNRT
ncbi:MAG: glycosyltransferase family 2 protein [bacterium]